MVLRQLLWLMADVIRAIFYCSSEHKKTIPTKKCLERFFFFHTHSDIASFRTMPTAVLLNMCAANNPLTAVGRAVNIQKKLGSTTSQTLYIYPAISLDVEAVWPGTAASAARDFTTYSLRCIIYVESSYNCSFSHFWRWVNLSPSKWTAGTELESVSGQLYTFLSLSL